MVYGVVFFVIGYMYSSQWIYDNVFVPYMNTWLEYEKMGIQAENMALLPIWFPILGVYTVFYWAITGYGWWRITTKTGVDLG
jgi:hypothetical protein